MKPMEWSVQGKTALVTGATSGIGKATAAELTRAGATVVIGARNTERARQAQADIRSETGVDVEVVIFDLARLGSVAAAAEELAHRFGRLHVLVNNAGILIGGRRRVTPDGFELSFAVNHL